MRTDGSLKEISLEKLYEVSFVLFVISRIMFTYTHLPDLLGAGVSGVLEDGLLLCALGLLALVIWRYKSPKNTFILLILGFGIIGLSYVNSRASNLFMSALFFYYSGVVRDKKGFATLVIRLYTAIILLLAALSLCGLIDLSVTQRTRSTAIRSSLGFVHPNQLAMMAFVMICMIFYRGMENRRRNRDMDYIIAGILTVVVFLITNTMTFLALAFLLFVPLFAYDAVLSHFSMSRKATRHFVRMGLAVIGLVAGFFVYHFWKNPLALKGALVTFRARFLLSQKYIAAYGIQPFGSRIVVGTDVVIPGFERGYYYLDNGYIRLFVENGLLAGLIVVFLLIRAIVNLTRHGKWKLLVILLCFMLYVFNEQKILTLYFNPFWVLLREYMLPARKLRVKSLTLTLPASMIDRGQNHSTEAGESQ